MSGISEKFSQSTWVKWAVLGLVIVASQSTLIACQQITIKSKSPEQLKNSEPTKTEQQQLTQQHQDTPLNKSEQQQSAQKLEQNVSAQSSKVANNQKKERDTQADDDLN